MTRVRLSIVANFVGQGWSALLGFLLLPFYLRLMGAEAFGLTGFYQTLLITLNVFDFGFSTTINRELARSSAADGDGDDARDLVRTMEAAYWSIGAVLGILVVMASPLLASRWINARHLATAEVTRAIALMGCTVVLQWPLSLYQGGLAGLQRQVRMNGISASVGTIRGGGAVLVLCLVSPSITAFFGWQLFVSVVQVGAYMVALWRCMPTGTRAPRLNWQSLWSLRRFSAGIGGIGILSLMLTQLDKIVLSRVLPLEMFGYYMVAAAVVPALRILSNPLNVALFPRFAELVQQGNTRAVKGLYHRGVQLMAAIVLPAAAVVALFPHELLLLWTRNPTAARIAAPIAVLLAIGTAMNSLVALACDVQWAYGWTSLGFYKNLIAVALLAPLIVVLAAKFGAVGAASVWVILNAAYLLVEIPVMHRRLLRGEMLLFYLADVGRPLVAVLAVVVIGRFAISRGGFVGIELLLSLVVIGALGTCAAALAVPGLRRWIVRRPTELGVAPGA